MNAAGHHMSNIQRLKLVTELIAAANAAVGHDTRNATLDKLAKPLIDQLVAESLITMDCHIEWSGMFEHGVVPIFWFDADEGDHCANVNNDASFDKFK